jgi:hypothetical protein
MSELASMDKNDTKRTDTDTDDDPGAARVVERR